MIRSVMGHPVLPLRELVQDAKLKIIEEVKAKITNSFFMVY